MMSRVSSITPGRCENSWSTLSILIHVGAALSDAVDALRDRIAQYHPDLVIVDMMMPKKSGFLVLEKLKSRGGGPPIIMITANEGSRHRAYAEMLGADDYIRKPFAMDKLLESVERLCPPVHPPST